MLSLPQPVDPHLTDLADVHAATCHHATANGAQASSVNCQSELLAGRNPQRLSEAELRDFAVKVDRAAEQILRARGGVPVPEGTIVAEMDSDGNLHWAEGAPFPEMIELKRRV